MSEEVFNDEILEQYASTKVKTEGENQHEGGLTL